MPATFAHPAAVLPLRRSPLDFTALVVGSLTPDVGYFVGRVVDATAAHTFRGSFIWCVPSGLVLLLGLALVRRPIWFLLPEPHRSALQPAATSRRTWGAARLAIILVSLLLGAWTHILWDSFTHETAYFVRRLPLLREAPVFIRSQPLAGYYILQQLSTLLGSLAIALVYFRWLSRQRLDVWASWRADWWRYLTWAAALLLPVLIAVPQGLNAARHYEGYLAVRVFVFQSAVPYLSAAVVAIILAAVIASTLSAITKKTAR